MVTVRRAAMAAALFAAMAPLPAVAQVRTDSLLSKALDLETDGKCREAIPLYQLALSPTDPAGAILGLERCHMLLGQPDPLLAILDSVLAQRPRDPVARVAHLRTLAAAGRFDAAALAFRQWTFSVPEESAPYREYARILLDLGRTQAADTVLTRASRMLGTREIAAELAELRGALGMWEASARSWREAMARSSWMVPSAVFILGPAPAEARDSIRQVLAEPPADLSARRILAGLELRWRSASEAWVALMAVAPSDSAVQAWVEFAGEAESAESWATARDAYAQALRHGASPALGVKAAAAALAAGDAASALQFVDALETTRDSVPRAAALLLRVQALTQLGKTAEAERLVTSRWDGIDPVARGDAVRALAWGWVQVGDLDRARAILARAGETDERVSAWTSLFEGNLDSARTGLRRLDETSREAVLALAVLARTRAARGAGVGKAFLALARRDTAAAARDFEHAALELPDAAPLLLTIAARLVAETQNSAHRQVLWQQILDRHPDAPEAAEVLLDWARLLRRRADAAGAVARLEQLILTYPESALVPQARRELELARGTIPPGVEAFR